MKAALRNLVIRALRSERGRTAGLALVRHRDSARVPPRVGRKLDAVLRLQQADAAERSATVGHLVELFFDLCALDDIDLFVEAGAKEGTASRRAAAAGCPRVIAFEANPYTHTRFVKRFERSSAEYVHSALTDVEGPVTFMVRRHDDGTPIPDGQGSLLIRPDHEPGYEEVIVDGIRLDTYLGDGRVERAAMWVDVEGAVDKVFGGAPMLLGSCDVLLVEVESRKAWDGQAWLDTDVTSALVEFDLVPIARDAQSRHQYNILYLRRARRSDLRFAQRISVWRRGARPAVAERA